MVARAQLAGVAAVFLALVLGICLSFVTVPIGNLSQYRSAPDFAALGISFTNSHQIPNHHADVMTGSRATVSDWFADDAIMAWKNGQLSVKQLHSALSLEESVIPAAFACHWLNRTIRGLDRKEGDPCFYVRSPIPVVGTVVVRKPEMVRRLVYSIDVPVQSIVVVHNRIPGKSGDRDAEEMTGVLSDLQRTLGERFLKIVAVDCNRGCAGGWNSILHAAPNVPWWFIVNDDVAFKPGSLRDLSDYVQREPQAAIFELVGLRTFVLTREGVQRVGVFDENIWPAYHEDCDYGLRVTLSGIKQIRHGPPTYEIMHGDIDEGTSSTLTSGADDNYRKRNDCSHNNNAYYYSMKWNTSGDCGTVEEGMFKTPFNNPDHTVASWTFDPLLRLRSETCWDPNASSEVFLMENEYGRKALVGDVVATAHSREVMSFWPVGSTPNALTFVVGSRSFCISPAAY